MIIKRTLDILLASLAMIVFSPLLLPITLLLKFTGEGEVFYIQKRVGKNGKIFGLVKFATMLKDSPNLPGGDLTSAHDPRVLPAGRLLRKTKLNELPQLWNILKGDISFVGPRPLTPRNFDLYSENVQEGIKTMQPGLTGIGSIVFRDEESILAASHKPALDCYCEDIAPYKGQLELWYKQHCNLLIDMTLMLCTLWVIFFPKTIAYERILKDLPKKPDMPKLYLENEDSVMKRSSSFL